MKDLDFPARINIGCALPSAHERAVVRYNEALVASGETGIAFAPRGVAIPHCTLLSGVVAGPADLAYVQSKLSTSLARSGPRAFSLGLPYLAKPDSRYVFADVLPGYQFDRERVFLARELSSAMELNRSGGPENSLHVTLGHVDFGRPLPEPEVSSVWSEPGLFTVVRISLTGPRGTCVRVLEAFEL